MTSHNFIVGTFNTPSLYTLSFTTPTSTSSKGSLKILKRHDAIGSHSWLALSANKKNLYATAWTEPPTIASYAIKSSTEVKLLNTAATKSRSGYVCCSNTHVYSAGGATGEVFAIDPSIGALASPSSSSSTQPSTNGHSQSSNITPVQNLNFVSDQGQRDDGSTMDFGGLRHGSHSADLSPDNSLLYIADIGRNCIWTYNVSSSSSDDKQQLSSVSSEQHLTLVEKHISPRSHDGPRHAHPHPNGRILYVLQEHSSMVDVFTIDPSTSHLTHIQGVRIIPHGFSPGDFWADEVRTSLSSQTTNPSSSSPPKYLYASTRGLKPGQKGYVAVYALLPSGLISSAKEVEHPGSAEAQNDQDQGGLLAMYETANSGGWANAVQPGPTVDGTEYLALTDSEEGLVFVLGWDGKELKEVARTNLNDERAESDRGVVGAATAVWL